MATEKRIRASQLNGAKSRGPITPEGKSQSFSKPNEARPLWPRPSSSKANRPSSSTTSGRLPRRPQTHHAQELALAEYVVHAIWRRNRSWEMETADFNEQIAKKATAPAERAAALSPISPTTPAPSTLPPLRFRFERQYHPRLNQLRNYQEGNSQNRNLPSKPDKDVTPAPSEI